MKSVLSFFIIFFVILIPKFLYAQAGDGLYFQSDFENTDISCWQNRPNTGGWNYDGCDGFVNIGQSYQIELSENEIAHSGNRALKVTYKKDEDYGAADVFIPESERVFTRFYEYYDGDYDFGFGVKSHRLRSFNKEIDNNNFDIIVVTWGQATSGDYDYTGMNDMKELSIGANGGPTEWEAPYANLSFQRERWYCVETEVKLNTPGQSNGEVRVWVDGQKVIEDIDINIRGNTNNKLDLIMFGGWHSSSLAG